MVMIFTDFAYSKLFMYVMLISNTGVLELRFDFRYFFLVNPCALTLIIR